MSYKKKKQPTKKKNQYNTETNKTNQPKSNKQTTKTKATTTKQTKIQAKKHQRKADICSIRSYFTNAFPQVTLEISWSTSNHIILWQTMILLCIYQIN